MEELTEGQRKPLFQLVRHQRQSGKEIVYGVTQGWDIEIWPWHDQEKQETTAKVPREVYDLWMKSDFISPSERGVGGGPLTCRFSTFMLKKSALDYERFMSKPGIIRAAMNLWQGLAEDVPSLVWGIVGGTVSAVITVIILNWLGMMP